MHATKIDSERIIQIDPNIVITSKFKGHIVRSHFAINWLTKVGLNCHAHVMIQTIIVGVCVQIAHKLAVRSTIENLLRSIERKESTSSFTLCNRNTRCICTNNCWRVIKRKMTSTLLAIYRSRIVHELRKILTHVVVVVACVIHLKEPRHVLIRGLSFCTRIRIKKVLK